jgi:hypothetical protein
MVEELGFNPTKLFVVSDVGPKKLSLASYFLNVLIFVSKAGAFTSRASYNAPHCGQSLWKSFPGTYTLAYFTSPALKKKKSFKHGLFKERPTEKGLFI